MNEANPFLAKRRKRPRRRRARFASNHEALAAFVEHVELTKSTATTTKHRQHLHRFLAYLGPESVYDQSSDDLLDFYDTVAQHCRYYKHGGTTDPHGNTIPAKCLKDRPLDCNACPVRRGLSKQSVGHYVVSTNKFYRYLTSLKHLDANPAQAASDEWWEENKRLIQKERANSGRANRFLTHEEAVQWVNGTSEIQWSTFALLLLRYGFRASEMVRLSIDAEYLDPGLTWLRVPPAPGNDGKRLVSDAYPIDEEVRRYLAAYLRWRRAKLERLGVTSSMLFVSRSGKEFAARALNAAGQVNPSLKRTAHAAGLDCSESVTSHVGRRFFSDRAQEHGFHGNRLKLVRGDFLRSEATGRYLDAKRLSELWPKASPPLGVRPPPGYYAP